MPLSARDIKTAFATLSDELARQRQRAEIIVMGGAAMVLLFGARESTKDVDAYFVSPEAATVREAWRDAIDRDDAKSLLSHMTGSSKEIWKLVRPFVPSHQLDKASYAFDDLWEALHGSL